MAKKDPSVPARHNSRALSFLATETRHPSTNFVPPAAGTYAFAGSILPDSGGLILSFLVQLPKAPRPGPKVIPPVLGEPHPAS